MSALLEVGNFSLDYATNDGAVHALRNISLTVEQGEILGVVGESGCGKSSLAGAILRLLPMNASTRGEVLFKQRNLCALPELELRALRGNAISAVFQEPMRAHNPVLTIGSQMIDIQYREPIARAEKLNRAREMLCKVGIAEAERNLKLYPHQLSGGMLQRIAIAMALLSSPDLLVADEPTTALDATLEVQIIDLLRALQRDYGCSVLLITHHLGVVAELCDKVAVMYAGEVVEWGAMRDVFYQPTHPYTRRLLECNPSAIKKTTGRLPTIRGDVTDLTELPAGCAFAPRCDSALPKCATSPSPNFTVDRRKVMCWLGDTNSVQPS